MTVKLYYPSARDLELGITKFPGFCDADIGQTIPVQCPRQHMRYPPDYEGPKFCKRHAREAKHGR